MGNATCDRILKHLARSLEQVQGGRVATCAAPDTLTARRGLQQRG